jgi:hypothetical protein
VAITPSTLQKKKKKKPLYVVRSKHLHDVGRSLLEQVDADDDDTTPESVTPSTIL